MNRFFAPLFMVLAAALLLAPPADARSAVKADGWGPGSSYGAMYDASSVETVTGRVVSIDSFTPPGARYSGVRVNLATSLGLLEVHLGPDWFIDNQDFSIEAGDTMEVRGSRVEYRGGNALMADRVRKGEKDVLLRDARGIPYWQHYGRHLMK